MDSTAPSKPTGSQELWLDAAYQVLTDCGVEAVKIMPLARKLGLTRTGFYWYFKDRHALLETMVQRWEDKNTGNLVARTRAYAESITEAMLNLFDCWHSEALFDSRLDLAIRNWARNDPNLQVRLTRADETRIDAVAEMFKRFGYSNAQAEVRSMTVIYTQIGYISMQAADSFEQRIMRVPQYVEIFTGIPAKPSEIDRFQARHRKGHQVLNL